MESIVKELSPAQKTKLTGIKIGNNDTFRIMVLNHPRFFSQEGSLLHKLIGIHKRIFQSATYDIAIDTTEKKIYFFVREFKNNAIQRFFTYFFLRKENKIKTFQSLTDQHTYCFELIITVYKNNVENNHNSWVYQCINPVALYNNGELDNPVPAKNLKHTQLRKSLILECSYDTTYDEAVVNSFLNRKDKEEKRLDTLIDGYINGEIPGRVKKQ